MHTRIFRAHMYGSTTHTRITTVQYVRYDMTKAKLAIKKEVLSNIPGLFCFNEV